MAILSLDVGTRTGWATYADGQYSGQELFPVYNAESSGLLSLRYREWLQEMKRLIGPIDFICFTQSEPINQGDERRIKSIVNTLEKFSDKYEIRLIRNKTGFYSTFQIDSSSKDTYQFVKAARAQAWSPGTYREAKAILLLEYETKLYVRSKEPWLAAV
jgi:hypothetical protein